MRIKDVFLSETYDRLVAKYAQSYNEKTVSIDIADLREVLLYIARKEVENV